MKTTEKLREQIADQMTIAINGGDYRACFLNIIALIEGASLTADTKPTEPFAAPTKRPLVELASLPV